VVLCCCGKCNGLIHEILIDEIHERKTIRGEGLQEDQTMGAGVRICVLANTDT
jgi:hypothetical protein